MKRLNEISARLQTINQRQEAIENEIEEKHEGVFTEELRAEYTGLQEEFDSLTAEKTQLEEDAQRIADRQGRTDADLSAVAPRQTPANSNDPHPHPTTRTQVIPVNARRVSSLRNFRGERNGMRAEERAYRFGMWCLHALSNDMPGRFNFPEATNYVRQNIQGALHQSNDSTGYGHLIPEEFGMDLVVLREDYGVARRTFRVVPMGSDVRSDPRRVSGLTAYFVGEGSAGTTSSGTKDRISLVAKDLMVLTTMSSNLSADAAMDVGDDLVGEIAYAFANKEDECAFNGDGTSTYGQIVGVRPKLQDVDGGGTDSAGLVTQATGSTWGAIVLADFHSTIGKLPQYADTPETVWICHKTFYETVMLALQLASGGVTGREVAEGDRRPRPTFLGYPVGVQPGVPQHDGDHHGLVHAG